MDFLLSMVKKKLVGEQALYNVGHGPVLKWLALCIYLCMYFSVFTPLTRPLLIISSNLA